MDFLFTCFMNDLRIFSYRKGEIFFKRNMIKSVKFSREILVVPAVAVAPFALILFPTKNMNIPSPINITANNGVKVLSFVTLNPPNDFHEFPDCRLFEKPTKRLR